MVINILIPECFYFRVFWRPLFYNQHLSNYQEDVMIKSCLNEGNKVRKVHKVKKTNRHCSNPACMLTSLGTTQSFCPAKPFNGLFLGTNVCVSA